MRADLLGFAAFLRDVDADARLVPGDRLGVEAGIGDDLDAPAGEAALDRGADVLVLGGNEGGQVFEQGHLRPEVVVHRRELAADGAGADDHDVLREGRRSQHIVTGQDPLPVRGQARQALDPASGGQDHVGRLEDAVAAATRFSVVARLGDADLVRSLEPASSGDPGHLVLVDQGLEPGPQALHDLILSGGHLDVVDAGLAGDRQPVVLGVMKMVDKARGLEERLGRDTPAMKAGPADLVLVDERDLQAQLGRSERRRVAARPGAEHHEIEVIGRADGHGINAPRGPRTGALEAAGWAVGSCAAMVRGPS